MSESQPPLQMGHDTVIGPDGKHHIRTSIQCGPVAAVLVLPTDVMRRLCAAFADLAADMIPEVERMNVMGDFTIVSGDALPKLPPLDGIGRPS